MLGMATKLSTSLANEILLVARRPTMTGGIAGVFAKTVQKSTLPMTEHAVALEARSTPSLAILVRVPVE